MVLFETNRFTLRFLAICIALFSLSLALAAVIASNWVFNRYDVILCSSAFVYIFATTSGILFFGRLAFMPISDLHSMKTAILNFLVNVGMQIKGKRAFRELEVAMQNPRQAQHELLMDTLRENGATEYAKKFNLSSVTDREDFRRKHPLTTYEDYRPYIDRMANNNELSLLSKEAITRFSVSSGTTGKCKLLPVTNYSWGNSINRVIVPLIAKISELGHQSTLAPLKSSMMVYSPKWQFTEHGLLIGPASGTPKNELSAVRLCMRTLPAEADVYLSEPGQIYLHWLFTLMDRHMGRIDTTFAGTILVALEQLRHQWPQLVEDIRNGKITRNNPEVPLDVIQTIEAAGHLQPNPRRASELQREFEKGFEGILARIFPRLYAVLAATTGAHSIYVDKVRWFLGPKIRLISTLYGASEGVFALNMTPEADETVYTMCPLSAFFEFIPEAFITQANPPTLFIDQLQSGRRYEVVVTNLTGFYRYRMGDIIEVVGFHGESRLTPNVTFCSRVGSIMDLRGEKTNEAMILSALNASILHWQGCRALNDYTTTECVSLAKAKSKPIDEDVAIQYVLFVELEGVQRKLSRDEILQFDSILSEAASRYKAHRIKKSIGEPIIHSVKPGTFLTMKQATLQRNGTVSNQYKTPRYISDTERLSFLLKSSY